MERTYLKQLNARNKKIRRAGFNNYQEFLKSKIWKDIKKNWLSWAKRNGKISCECCGYVGKLELHHKRYGKILKVGYHNLIVQVCRRCHQEISDISYQTGISIRTATRQIKKKYCNSRQVITN